MYAITIAFIAGVLFGVAVMVLGLFLGTKMSYEIRNASSETSEGKGLLTHGTDDGEFELAEEDD